MSLFSLNLLAQLPKPSFSDPNAPPFIVRFQRVRSDKRACAIVRGDGFFHEEMETPGRFEVWEGAIDDAELVNLRTLLNNSDLAALTQKQITMPLLMTRKDEFLVSILRSPKTQDLAFLDHESRQPYAFFIEPLVQWLDQLQRHPHASLGEFEGRNQCLPPRQVKFSSRRAAGSEKETPPVVAVVSGPAKTDTETTPTANSSAAHPKNPFLMVWQTQHIVNEIESVCVVVYPSGGYHMEKSSQAPREKPKSHIFEDSLDSTSLQQLETLLNEPELKASAFRDRPNGQMFREGDLTSLTVYREGHVQQLSFADFFAIPGANVNSHTDPEKRVVAPLRKWLNIHIESKKLPALPGANPNRCAPQPQE